MSDLTTNLFEENSASPETETQNQGIKLNRHFTSPEINPFDQVKWETKTATIADDKGKVLFEQKNIEVPAAWSQTAINVVVQKYFHGTNGTSDREHSIKQVINRVSQTMTNWGVKDGYFATAEDAETFYHELTYMIVNQIGTFNSPVWFNVGIEEKPQCSACFIMSVDDDMNSILQNAVNEGMLFKFGSGTGSNRSKLRSSKEAISGGGKASGPLSFMKIYDSVAGSIKSGGKTRRAAKMEILNVDHPDILEFINTKSTEEKKAWALIEQGYDGSFNGEAYASVFFQNSNFSVRATDEFMNAVVNDLDWTTHEISTGKPSGTYKARDVMKAIAEGTYICGDPGMQFDSIINKWHTSKNTDKIYASNPCSEYMFLDDTACNLASINLMKFRREDGSFDVEGFRYAVDIFILAQEIIIANAGYPTEKIEKNSHDFRPLGLGFANLGAFIMSNGMAYDSDAGRAVAGAITSVMCGEAYLMSAKIAKEIGAFAGYEINRDPMLEVIAMHRDAVKTINLKLIEPKLMEAAIDCWDSALSLGTEFGYRNAQVTVLAPTGTIAFMMDCDTTGIEPDIALVKYKKLSGGGMLKLVNNTVPMALERLGYSEKEVADITDYIDKNDTIENAPGFLDEHLPVFDCAFKPMNGTRSINYLGHIKMMSACQPFLSGAISKTVNMPTESTVEEIMNTYIEGWKLGLKAVAIYRDGSKRSQPLNTSMNGKSEVKAEVKTEISNSVSDGNPRRHRLPDERQSITHKFSVGGHEGYITVGLYEDGMPGEVFITMSKEGSTISGFMDAFATATSLALQYGVPLHVLTNKFSHMRFEPSGFTGNKQIPIAKSIIDYIFRWLALKFIPTDESVAYSDEPKEEKASDNVGETVESFMKRYSNVERNEKQVFKAQADAPPCSDCGSIMVRNGSCYRCLNCGATSGCS